MAYYNVDKTANFDKNGDILKNWIQSNSMTNINIKDDIAYLTNMNGLFYYKDNVKSINLSGLKTNYVTNMNYAFYCCNNLQTLYLSNIANVTDLSAAFGYCKNLQTFPNLEQCYNVTKLYYTCQCLEKMTNINRSTVGYVNYLSKVTDLCGTFYGCNGLTNVSLTYWNAPYATRTAYLWAYCNSATNINMRHGNFPNVTSTQNMFYMSTKLKNIDLSNCHFYNVDSTSGMFAHCWNLVNLNISGTGTFANITNASSMFQGCENLDYCIHSTWNFYKCTNFAHMYDRSKLSVTEWDWNMNNAIDLSAMFNGCPNLTEVYALQSWTLPKATNLSQIFAWAGNFRTLRMNTWKPNNVQDMSYMFIMHPNIANVQINDWTNLPLLTTAANMFESCPNLQDVNFSGWNAPNVKDMSWMFAGCTNLYLHTFPNTFLHTNVLDASFMFDDCYNITNIPQLVNGWRLARNSHAMFNGCRNLAMNINNCNISRVNDASKLFKDCWKITYYSGTYGDNTTNTSQMFYNCGNLTYANIYYWTPSNLTNMANMFYNCIKLETISMNKFKCEAMTNLSHFCYNCTNLKTFLGAEVFFNNCTNLAQAFYNCGNLGTYLTFNNTNFHKVTNASQMFYNCRNITTLNATGWNFCNLTSASWLFDNCTRLYTLITDGWNLAKITNVGGWFYNCNMLSTDSMDNIGRALLTAKNVTYKNLNPNNSYSPFYGSNRNSTYFNSLTILSQLAANGWTQ